jgi:hypothetical protein
MARNERSQRQRLLRPCKPCPSRTCALEYGQNGSAPELQIWDSDVANLKEMTRMSNQINPTKLVNSRIPTEIEKLRDQKQLDLVASGAAQRAGKTERRYDQDHHIFAK